MFQIELGNQQVDDGDEVGDEHAGGGDAAIVAHHGQEEVDAGYGADQTVDGDVLSLVDQSGELPDGESGDNGKEKRHGLRT